MPAAGSDSAQAPPQDTIPQQEAMRFAEPLTPVAAPATGIESSDGAVRAPMSLGAPVVPAGASAGLRTSSNHSAATSGGAAAAAAAVLQLGPRDRAGPRSALRSPSSPGPRLSSPVAAAVRGAGGSVTSPQPRGAPGPGGTPPRAAAPDAARLRVTPPADAPQSPNPTTGGSSGGAMRAEPTHTTRSELSGADAGDGARSADGLLPVSRWRRRWSDVDRHDIAERDGSPVGGGKPTRTLSDIFRNRGWSRKSDAGQLARGGLQRWRSEQASPQGRSSTFLSSASRNRHSMPANMSMPNASMFSAFGRSEGGRADGGLPRKRVRSRGMVVSRGTGKVSVISINAVADGLHLPARALARALTVKQSVSSAGRDSAGFGASPVDGSPPAYGLPHGAHGVAPGFASPSDSGDDEAAPCLAAGERHGIGVTPQRECAPRFERGRSRSDGDNQGDPHRTLVSGVPIGDSFVPPVPGQMAIDSVEAAALVPTAPPPAFSSVRPGVLRYSSHHGTAQYTRCEPGEDEDEDEGSCEVLVGDSDVRQLEEDGLGLVIRQSTTRALQEVQVASLGPVLHPRAVSASSPQSQSPTLKLNLSHERAYTSQSTHRFDSPTVRSRANDEARSLLSGMSVADIVDGEGILPKIRRKVAFAADPVEDVQMYDADDDGVVMRVVMRFPPQCFVALLLGGLGDAFVAPTLLDAHSHGLGTTVAAARVTVAQFVGAAGICLLWFVGVVLVVRTRPHVSQYRRPSVILPLLGAGACRALGVLAQLDAANESHDACGGAACPPVALQALPGVLLAIQYGCAGERVHVLEYAGVVLAAVAGMLLYVDQLGGYEEWRADLCAAAHSCAAALELLLLRRVAHRVAPPPALLAMSAAGLVVLFVVGCADGQGAWDLLQIGQGDGIASIAGVLHCFSGLFWLFALLFVDPLAIAATEAGSMVIGAAGSGSGIFGGPRWAKPTLIVIGAAPCAAVAIALCCYCSVRHRNMREIGIAVGMPAIAGRGRPCAILRDRVRVKRLVDALSCMKGGPLPEWNNVYADHCGAVGFVAPGDERSDVGCCRVEFPDGYRYWFPTEAIAFGPSQSQIWNLPQIGPTDTGEYKHNPPAARRKMGGPRRPGMPNGVPDTEDTSGSRP